MERDLKEYGVFRSIGKQKNKNTDGLEKQGINGAGNSRKANLSDSELKAFLSTFSSCGAFESVDDDLHHFRVFWRKEESQGDV